MTDKEYTQTEIIEHLNSIWSSFIDWEIIHGHETADEMTEGQHEVAGVIHSYVVWLEKGYGGEGLRKYLPQDFIHGPKTERVEGCNDCNLDTHRCPGCGDYLWHSTDVCGLCAHEVKHGR